MADTPNTSLTAPTTEEGFLADRLTFWHSATKFMTNIIVGLVLLLLFLWWWLV